MALAVSRKRKQPSVDVVGLPLKKRCLVLKQPVGQWIEKRFSGHGVFVGQCVSSKLPDANEADQRVWYTITYTDGDVTSSVPPRGSGSPLAPVPQNPSPRPPPGSEVPHAVVGRYDVQGGARRHLAFLETGAVLRRTREFVVGLLLLLSRVRACCC